MSEPSIGVARVYFKDCIGEIQSSHIPYAEEYDSIAIVIKLAAPGVFFDIENADIKPAGCDDIDWNRFLALRERHRRYQQIIDLLKLKGSESPQELAWKSAWDASDLSLSPFTSGPRRASAPPSGGGTDDAVVFTAAVIENGEPHITKCGLENDGGPMNQRMRKWESALAATMIAASAVIAWAQEKASQPTVPVSLVVSVEAKHGKDIQTIYKEDVRVFHDRDRLKVQDWVPYQGEHAGLELFLLIDDATDTSAVGQQLDDLRKFINGQASTTMISVGYIRSGTVGVIENFTTDHSLAAKALRLPLGTGGGFASPYLAITDLIKRWPQSTNRRQILMVSSGIDALQPGSVNSYLDQTIDQAQRSGVQVYSIYASPPGHFGHTLWRYQWGQNNLSRLADETGGEAYFQALGMPIAYAPYLDQFAERLKYQFRLTFLAKPGKEGEFQRIRLETEVPNTELVAASSVYIPAAR